MGDSKEGGAESPPAGAAAREGLSLLSQGESEEPSAQVSRSRGWTCRAPGAAGPLGEGVMLRFPVAAVRLPGSPPAGGEAPVSMTWRSGICIQVTRVKGSSGFPLGYTRRAAVPERECVAPQCGTVVQSCGEKSGCRGAPSETGSR